jgi:ATP-binding cassette subfamily C protein
VQSSDSIDFAKTARTLRRFAATLVATAPREVAEGIALSMGLGLTEGAGLLLLVPLLGLVGIDTGRTGASGILARVNGLFGALHVTPTLPVVLATYVVIMVVQSALQRRQQTLSGTMTHDVVEALRRRLYRAIASARWTFLASTRSSDYTYVLTEAVERVGTATFLIIDVAATGAIVAAYIVMAARVSLVLTAVVAVSGLVLGLIVRPLVARSVRSGQARAGAWTDLYATVTEHLASIKLAKGYGIERRHAELFDQMAGDLGRINRAAASDYARVKQVLSIASAVLLAAIVYFAYGVLHIAAGSLLLLLFLFGRLVPRVTSLYERVQSIGLEVAPLDRVLEVEQRCLAAAEPPSQTPQPIAFRDRVELAHVSFAYQSEGREAALRDVSLVVRAGTTTAIVGPSGAGKSTIADVLLGLLDPQAGQVRVDEVPLGPERLQAWRDQIGYVAQDGFLFHDTIAANLRWARPDATDGELWEALQLASVAEFVGGLPQQLDTVLGDRGILVSGGERQRLSLARALLRRPALLILDEPTSSLDSENEQRIQAAVDGLHEQITILLITHRLSTIRHADLIHVVEHGSVIESGSWRELIGRRGSRFRELCLAQGIDISGRAELSVVATPST